MTSEPADSKDADSQLGAVLAACIEAVDRGEADPNELLARYPEFESELTEFFTSQNHLDRLAAPLRVNPHSPNSAKSASDPVSPPSATSASSAKSAAGEWASSTKPSKSRSPAASP
jgi:hypothetical protein